MAHSTGKYVLFSDTRSRIEDTFMSPFTQLEKVTNGTVYGRLL